MAGRFPPLPSKTAAAWAVFLDVDGTLVDIADHPERIVVPGALPEVLRRLHRLLGGAAALISGRSIESLDRWIGVADLDVAGCHGAEFRIGGRDIVADRSFANFQILGNEVSARVRNIAGAWVETKPHALTLHFREPDLSADRAQAILREVVGDTASLRIIMGKNVAEIAPAAAGKDVAIARFLTEAPYRQRRPVFIGDDVTDEDGFAEVNRRDGYSVRVGPEGQTQARFVAASPTEVRLWLEGPVMGALEHLSEASGQ